MESGTEKNFGSYTYYTLLLRIIRTFSVYSFFYSMETGHQTFWFVKYSFIQENKTKGQYWRYSLNTHYIRQCYKYIDFSLIYISYNKLKTLNVHLSWGWGLVEIYTIFDYLVLY